MLTLQVDADALRTFINEAVASALPTTSAAKAPEYLTLKAAAKYLDCSESTVRGWVDDGHVPGYQWGRIVRVKRHELDALLAGKAAGQ